MITLADVIRQVESGNRRFAMRFEPVLYQDYAFKIRTRDPVLKPISDRICAIHECSRLTSAMIAATSWGLYQILGVNLYDTVCGPVKVPIGLWMGRAEEQDTAFAQFSNKRCPLKFSTLAPWNTFTDMEKTTFARVYNGPGDVPAYLAQMENAARVLGG